MQATGSTSDPRLARFLALAALFHALVILLAPMGREAAAPLKLQLALAHPAQAPDAAAAPPSHQAPPAPPTPAPISSAMARADAPQPAPPATTHATENAESAPAPGAASARVIAQVRNALARYFVYPLSARRQGWQGEVLVGFSVTPEGRIDHLEVVRSSGYRILDDAALASLARVGSVPDYAADGPLQIRMPVIYRLEG